jgi:hypothetical protein
VIGIPYAALTPHVLVLIYLKPCTGISNYRMGGT